MKMRRQISLRIRIVVGIALWVFVVGVPGRAFAQCDPSIYGANPSDSVPDDSAIQQCLNQGGTTNLVFGLPGYIITNTLVISVPGTTLQDPSEQARLIADPSLQGQLLIANNVDNFTLTNLTFDGQKDNRDTAGCASSFDYGKNLRLVGNGWHLNSVRSRNAVCGSGGEVSGSNFEIANSFFDRNGYSATQAGGGGPWSDGLTVWSCVGGSIHDSAFNDNTDIDLVLGGGSNCSVTNNTMSNFNAHAFGGLQLGVFPGGNGNHGGFTYSGNTISSGLNGMAFGVIVGLHPWDSGKHLDSVGSVFGNSASGAVINLQIEADSRGIATGQVTGNSTSGAQGTFGYGNCTLSTDYAVYAPHAGVLLYDGGSLSLQYDDGQCTIR
jgi:hypothetical protein